MKLSMGCSKVLTFFLGPLNLSLNILLQDVNLSQLLVQTRQLLFLVLILFVLLLLGFPVFRQILVVDRLVPFLLLSLLFAAPVLHFRPFGGLHLLQGVRLACFLFFAFALLDFAQELLVFVQVAFESFLVLQGSENGVDNPAGVIMQAGGFLNGPH